MRQNPSVPVLTAAAILLVLLVGFAVAPASASFGSVPSIADTLRPAEWHYLGPFSVGPREGITGIADGPDDLYPPDSAHAQRVYPSMLAQGGYVEWKTAAADSSGWVNIKFDNVLWDTLAGVYGAAGIVNVTYAYAEFTCPASARALVVADRVGSFYLNGIQCLGDPYAKGFVRVPVVLRRGTNRLLAKLSGYGDPAFKLELVSAPGPVLILDDYTAPDVVRGEGGRFWIGVALLNSTPSRLRGATLTAGDGQTVRIARSTVGDLTALCVRKVPVELELAAPAQGDTLLVPIEIACEGGAFRDTLAVRVREPGQAAKRTFISGLDCSCQYCAVLPPADYDDRKEYALILTLHGAGVEAIGQAEAYKPKPWAFIVAPTNRRPYGFDWQDWGRLDAMEVLDLARSELHVDPDRVYLTGHSMGGHGVWHVGLSHPDQFAAIAPGAGWTSFDLYIPWFLQKSSIYAEPGQTIARNLALREDQPLDFVENARNLPAFIFQGGVDDNVPPVHARMLVSRLDELGYEYKYKEIPGKSHWWTIDSLQTSCVDDPDLMAYVQGLKRNRCPSEVVFKTTDLGKSDRAYWVKITEQEKPFSESEIEARVTREGRGVAAGEQVVDIRTKNVRQFAVHPCDGLLAGGELRLSVDGEETIRVPAPDGWAMFAKRGGKFRPGEAWDNSLHKTHLSYGPIKQAYFSPFVLVYGTTGDVATTEMLLNQARLEAMQWWIRGNGFVEILPDSEVTRNVVVDCNLILFGGPDENRIIKIINRRLPIRLVGDRLMLGGQALGGRGLAAKFVYPNPLNERKLVVVSEGTGMEGLKLSTFFGALSSASGLPDFMIFDSRVKQTGWGGVRAAGFFDSNWKVAKDLVFQ
jgi:dienelactone hydrolase